MAAPDEDDTKEPEFGSGEDGIDYVLDSVVI